MGSRREVTVHEAKTHLSRLLREVEAGYSVVVKRGRKVVARIVPATAAGERRIGGYQGKITMSPDFEAPLTDFEDYE